MNYEKISVNVNNDKIAKIDFLVENGFYDNRSDFINEAITLSLEQHQKSIDLIINNNKEISNDFYFIGITNIDKNYLLQVKKRKLKINIRGFGILVIDSDIDLSLLKDTIDKVSNKIKIQGRTELVQYLKSLTY